MRTSAFFSLIFVSAVLVAQAPAQAPAQSLGDRVKAERVALEPLRAELKYVTVKTIAKEYLLEESLTKLEEEFAGLFTRIHRSALVANKAVTGFEKADADEGDQMGEGVANGNGEGGGTHWVVVLKGVAEKLPVSRRQQHVIREF